jgi:hypothetical protein
MRTTTWIRGFTGIAILLASLAAPLVVTGCSGPERAPRQPITGVDRPAGDRSNPYDEPEEKEEEKKP